jgi:hypothetical protein
MTPEEQEKREECRRDVRAFLANRSVLAFRAGTIWSKLSKENDFTLDDVKAALAFLVSAGQASVEPESLGATPYYKITADGMLSHERAARPS